METGAALGLAVGTLGAFGYTFPWPKLWPDSSGAWEVVLPLWTVALLVMVVRIARDRVALDGRATLMLVALVPFTVHFFYLATAPASTAAWVLVNCWLVVAPVGHFLLSYVEITPIGEPSER